MIALSTQGLGNKLPMYSYLDGEKPKKFPLFCEKGYAQGTKHLGTEVGDCAQGTVLCSNAQRSRPRVLRPRHDEPSPGDPLGIMPVLYIIINKEEIRPKGGAV